MARPRLNPLSLSEIQDRLAALEELRSHGRDERTHAQKLHHLGLLVLRDITWRDLDNVPGSTPIDYARLTVGVEKKSLLYALIEGKHYPEPETLALLSLHLRKVRSPVSQCYSYLELRQIVGFKAQPSVEDLVSKQIECLLNPSRKDKANMAIATFEVQIETPTAVPGYWQAAELAEKLGVTPDCVQPSMQQHGAIAIGENVLLLPHLAAVQLIQNFQPRANSAVPQTADAAPTQKPARKKRLVTFKKPFSPSRAHSKSVKAALLAVTPDPVEWVKMLASLKAGEQLGQDLLDITHARYGNRRSPSLKQKLKAAFLAYYDELLSQIQQSAPPSSDASAAQEGAAPAKQGKRKLVRAGA